jgi:hypothetical protein
MTISVQQFDFIAETRGLTAALAAAEQAGGVTGTRDQATQIQLPGAGVETPTGMGAGWGGGLTRSGGEYMPGTLATDTSTALGVGGTAASGALNLMGGGGGVASAAQQQTLQDLIARGAATDTSGDLPNAPIAAPAAPAAIASFDQQILNRAQAGELIPRDDLAQMDDTDLKMQAVRAVLNNWIGEMTRLAGDADFAGVKNTYKSIYDLWQGFFDTSGDIHILMNDIAQEFGYGDNYFAGQERALASAGEEFDWTGTRGGNILGAFAQGQRDKISGFILDFASQTDDWTKAITAAAKNAFKSQDNDQYKNWAGANGVPEFASERDAYAFFVGFYSDNPDYWTAGTLGTEDTLGPLAAPAGAEGAGAAGAAGADGGEVAWSPAAQGWGVGGTQSPFIPAGTDLGGLGAAGLGAENRTFGDVFPGFLSTSPYADIPNIGSAIQGAQPFFAGQYAMEAPFIPETEIPAGQSRAGNWLRGLSTGDTGLLRGSPLAARLQEIAAALGQPASGSIGELGSGAVANPLRGMYADPKTSASAAQISAIQNPYYLATRGAPTSRALVMNAIQKAATDFAYKYPSGIPTAGSTTPEQFLPWALRTNLMGIQDLPEFQGMNWG